MEAAAPLVLTEAARGGKRGALLPAAVVPVPVPAPDVGADARWCADADAGETYQKLWENHSRGWCNSHYNDRIDVVIGGQA